MPKKVKTTVEFEGRVSEILVEVPDIETPLWGENAALDHVGHAVKRVDADKRVTGAAQYTTDIILPHLLYARILRSPHPHAVIKSIDTSRAEKVPGVKAVLSAFNTEPIRFHGTSFVFDKTVRLVGDEVAAVAAVDEETAADALELIQVEYEKLPFVLDMEEALKNSAPKLWPTGNLVGGKPNLYSRGDVAKGFQEADVLVEETFRTQTELHTCLETHGSVAQWEGHKLTVWDSTQAIFNVRDALAAALNMPANRVRVIKHFMGGGFGSKLELGKYTVIAALLARRTERPVQLILTREEDQINTGNRPATIQRVKVGVKKDGTLTAIELKSYNANGAYLAGAGCGAPYREMYLCPNVRTEEYAIFINAGRNRPTRAPGHVPGTFGLELMMDVVAKKIGMDPLELRRKNDVTVNQVQANPKPYSAKLLDKLYEEGAKKIEWWERKKRKESLTSTARKRGVGMASQIWGGGGGPPAYALVKINRDGTVNVFSGTQDLGTGTRTILTQIAADELGIGLSDVSVEIGDTETCPFSGASGGSTTAASAGPAVRTAAADARLQLFEYAALELKVKPEELAVRRGKIFVTSDPQKSVDFKAAARAAGNNMIIGKGFRGPNPQEYSLNTFGVHFAEVEVDTDTGQVTVLRHVAAHHSGRPFNPLTFRSQIEGAVIQSMGYALSEERVMDAASGIPLNMNMENYKPMTALDMPVIEPIVLTSADEHSNPLGGKGIGEPPRIPAAAAIANAVADAIGIHIKELPITPDKVLAALKSAAASPPAKSKIAGPPKRAAVEPAAVSFAGGAQ